MFELYSSGVAEKQAVERKKVAFERYRRSFPKHACEVQLNILDLIHKQPEPPTYPLFVSLPTRDLGAREEFCELLTSLQLKAVTYAREKRYRFGSGEYKKELGWQLYSKEKPPPNIEEWCDYLCIWPVETTRQVYEKESQMML
jgi:hypothetical protein